MKTPKKIFLDIKTPKNHPKSNVTKPNFNHPWQEGHAKISHKNPKTPFKNLYNYQKKHPYANKN